MPRSRKLDLALAVFISTAAAQLGPAQTEPSAYTVVQVNSLFGSPVTVTMMRDGAHAVIETGDVRSYYDLSSHKQWSLSIAHPESGCSIARWSGDWGDPFISEDIDKANPKQAGAETANGIPSNVYTADGGVKVWREPKTGLYVKVELQGKTAIETTKYVPGKPAVTMTPPAACLSQILPPSDQEVIAAETNDAAANYVRANTGPASKDSCTVFVRALKAVTMEPLTKFQIALDTTYTVENPGSRTTGIAEDGHLTFSGAGIHEVTSQLRNGVLRIDNAPATFFLDTGFGRAGEADAGIYRQCSGPQSVLLLLIKNPAKISDGADWLWVKSGKYAAVN